MTEVKPCRCPRCDRLEHYGATCICGQRTDMPVTP